MKLLLLSDIHGNRSAFLAVLDRASRYPDIGACVLLGDLIDYGPHSNEVIRMASHLPWPVLCNLRGNHEDAILREDYGRFSSERGKRSARHTADILDESSGHYISQEMDPRGKKEFQYAGKNCLATHGSLEDEYWKSISPEDSLTGYETCDYVFSGHSHLPHMMERYYPCVAGEGRNGGNPPPEEDASPEALRRLDRRKVIFINPGSVGQPRNLDPRAQFALLDMETGQIIFEKAAYDIRAEQAAFDDRMDPFYCERLRWGI